MWGGLLCIFFAKSKVKDNWLDTLLSIYQSNHNYVLQFIKTFQFSLILSNFSCGASITTMPWLWRLLKFLCRVSSANANVVMQKWVAIEEEDNVCVGIIKWNTTIDYPSKVTAHCVMIKTVHQRMIVFCHACRTSSQEQQNHSQDHLHPAQYSQLWQQASRI